MDYSSWPVKELRRFLVERRQDPTGIVEKADLVAKVGQNMLSPSIAHSVKGRSLLICEMLHLP